MQQEKIHQQQEWEFFVAALYRTLIDGSRSNGLLMRTRTSTGAWAYRKPSQEEDAEYVSRTAW